METSNIGKKEVNLIMENLKHMERKYDAFINALITSNEEDNGEEGTSHLR
jgi:hypothetical protein